MIDTGFPGIGRAFGDGKPAAPGYFPSHPLGAGREKTLSLPLQPPKAVVKWNSFTGAACAGPPPLYMYI